MAESTATQRRSGGIVSNMSFSKLISKVVGKKILNEKQFIEPWKSFADAGSCNYNLLSAPCGNGQAIPDNEHAALYYCLTYQKSHYDAVAAVLRAEMREQVALSGRWLVVDIGAGPATALLAFADEVRRSRGSPLDTSYVHVDTLAAMKNLANTYFDEDDNISADSTIRKVSNLSPSTLCATWVNDCDQAIFMFSYVLCQPSVSISSVRAFAAIIAKTCANLEGRPAYILMVDANLSGRSQWPALAEELRRLGLEIEASNPSSLDVESVYLRPDGSERQRRLNAGNVGISSRKTPVGVQMFLNDLFDGHVADQPPVATASRLDPAVPGLVYLDDFVTREEASRVTRQIDEMPWITDLRRRVQHYGSDMITRLGPSMKA